MTNFASTYRVQFNKEFTFRNLREQLEYLDLLGIGTIYASPVFSATPGSMHNYDVTDPLSINSEIGTLEELQKISVELKKKNMGWLQDIVPNHMAFSFHNERLMDVMEKGVHSVYADFFDINFRHGYFQGKLMVPFLGNPLKESVDKGEIRLDWQNGNFLLKHFDQNYPLNFETFQLLINSFGSKMPESFHHFWYDRKLPEKEAGSIFLNQEWPGLKKQLEELFNTTHSFQSYIEHIIKTVHAKPENLLEIAEKQHYMLCHWKDTEKRINYRRFFTVNSLICLQMERKGVFDEHHRFLRELISRNIIQGLRIDHIDGLFDPSGYLQWLRGIAGKETYVAVEKILEKGEQLPVKWPVQGSTGYDFLALVNNLFTCKKNYPALLKFYRKISGIKMKPEEVIYHKKKHILTDYMQGELVNLTYLLLESKLLPDADKLSFEKLREAIGEFLVACPVYKLYSSSFPLSAKDEGMVGQILKTAGKRNPAARKGLRVLYKIFLNRMDLDEVQKETARRFFMRCMQFTGPLMAKGVEDTTMYHYNCFVAHNEVGDAPHSQGLSVKQFHEQMALRQRQWPATMNTTSTHDTKRGEDVRARLNVISELPGEWKKSITRWMKINREFKSRINGILVPSTNEEYFIYQTLAGVFPIGKQIDDSLRTRISDYLVKALREAKVNTSWNNPNDKYEKAVLQFTGQILAPDNKFLELFLPFQKKIADYGIINSLSQLVLKCTCPGIPDIYQGTELWDLSLVDPDNRQPVDYNHRHNILIRMLGKKEHDRQIFINNLIRERSNGMIKLWVLHKLLQTRKQYPDSFLKGNYIPLEVTGKFKKHVVAFIRQHEENWFITIVPLFPYLLDKGSDAILTGKFEWNDTRIILPEIIPHQWKNILTQKTVSATGSFPLSEALETIPFGVFHGFKKNSGRQCGVLLHISSLPGKYGIGDFGKEAYRFVDFLSDTYQSYWQILPLNQVSASTDYSPYSATSAFAGNILFISPEFLYQQELIGYSNLISEKFPRTNKVNYKKSKRYKLYLLEFAYKNFKQNPDSLTHREFDTFCRNEKYWLDDYALYLVLKDELGDISWNQWPEGLRNRDAKELARYASIYARELEKIRFFQFLFLKQWKELKDYANNKGIKIIGDLPFYIGYDSADVWVNQDMFKLDDQKKMKSVAGVPPDYFSETGQLWNMPVFDWQNNKSNLYNWWVDRIRKNLEFYDLLRIDHFRAFSAYWEISASEKTAVNGKWEKGPGKELLHKIKDAFPKMPFIAEDLGNIDEEVISLRNRFNLPGMKVLQFAFNRNMPESSHIPHNYPYNSVAFVGTHDNNTIQGWYKNELDRQSKQRLNLYLARKVNSANCNLHLLNLALSSPAKLAIIRMQDYLGLGEKSRMNDPSTSHGNWRWKLKKGDISPKLTNKIKKEVALYNRK